MLLLGSKVFHTMDQYVDIEKFLSLEDKWYEFFGRNFAYATNAWSASGIPIDCDWPYLMNEPGLYFARHAALRAGDENIDKFKSANNNEGLCRYLQLKYGAFNPYKKFALVDSSAEYYPFVEDWIKEWVSSLPFTSVNIVSALFTDHHVKIKYHRDYNWWPHEQGDNREVPEKLPDFIWFRFDLNRPLKLYDIDSKGNITDEVSIQGYSATFNHFNWHGNMDGNDRASLTLKIQGEFTPEIKAALQAK